jgi:hypothetical protein
MEVKVIAEAGHLESLLGLGLSFGLTSGMDIDSLASLNNCEIYNKLSARAEKLAGKDGGHNKFLESITVWIDVNAPRFWWSEMDTYRVGMTKQSESTMHTLKRDGVKEDQFEGWVPEGLVTTINQMIADDYDIADIKNVLPDGFLQRRIICTNYKTLRHIILQRVNHKLPQWRYFCGAIESGVQHPEFLPEVK